MDKRYQVFVSSTFEDLQEERKEVMQALLELDCIPAGMELFPASSEDQWSLIKRVIDDCDYYLLIIGGRYGSINSEGISYTQMEFEYALETGKPIVSFLHENPLALPVSKSETDPIKKEKLENFRKLAKTKLIRTWDSPEKLGSVVSRSMIKLIKQFPAEGWIKSRYAANEELLRQIADLQRENVELANKLKKDNTSKPEGVDKYAQGDDIYRLRLELVCEGETESDLTNISTYIELTWNEIFIGLAPKLFEPCNERRFRYTLESLVGANSDRIINLPKGTTYVKNIKFNAKDYESIKVQLRALGLIEIVHSDFDEYNKEILLKLTPYGDIRLTQLLAIER